VVGGGIAYLGAFAAGQVMIARETSSLPHYAEVKIAGLAMSMVCIAALLPRHLMISRDPIAMAQRGLPANLDADVRGLVDRGVAVWRQASPKLDAENQMLLRDAVLRLHDLAGRWAKVDGSTSPVATLEARRAELDAKIEASRDDVAREQYREARGAVEDQLRYVAAIDQSRERVVARLHACVNTLEKFRLAAANLQSVGLLAEVSADITAAGDALAELPQA
jgi:outer membrane murein-binding lipoprotein Lpp